MGKIIQLPALLANQIAAWEVVERPISVIKELVENSIDAGCDTIKVELENGWIDLIIVSDTGEWIEKDDLAMITKKHTTSKITSLEDLQKVMTFWFRWEAIASIASVSELEIISKYKDSPYGYSLKNETITQSPIDSGTKVIVRDLFLKTPARLNYLKTPRTEYAKIYDFLVSMALMYPKIGFELIHDGKQSLFFAPNQDTHARIYKWLGSEFGENILEISGGIPGLQIEWYISDPKIHFKNKNKQFLYVNHRLIQSPMVYRAIADGYNRYIPHGTHPAYVINLEIDPTQIDVNVHPRKQEIRFADEQQVFRLVYHGISDKLEWLSLSSFKPNTHEISDTPWVSPEQAPQNYYTGSGTKFKSYSPYKNTQTNPAQWQITDAIAFSQALINNESDSNTPQEPRQSSDLHYTKIWKIIGQAFNSYIIVEALEWLLILDQHALAERIIYERLIKKWYTSKTQWLLISESFQLTASEYAIVDENIDILREFGFECEVLGSDILQVSGIPDFIQKTNLKEIIEWVISDLEESRAWKSKTLQEVKNKIAAYTSCRSAIKFWDKLNMFEMNTLLNDAVLDYSATCPHGRPVISELSLDTLKWMYDR